MVDYRSVHRTIAFCLCSIGTPGPIEPFQAPVMFATMWGYT